MDVTAFEASEEPAPRSERMTVVIPVYRNEGSIPRLCDQLEELRLPEGVALHVVFVVDGSPDRSTAVLEDRLARWSIPATLVLLARNFGSFAAIRAGLAAAEGDFFAVIAADLQEPPSLVPSFLAELRSGDVDLVLGSRESRADPRSNRAAADAFWRFYRRWVQPDMPVGGVDVFACNDAVRRTVLELEESNSSLVGQLLWIGYRRTTVGYDRLARTDGESAWTLSKKLRYLSDSIFSFTDLPIRLLLAVGLIGCVGVVLAAAAVLTAWVLDLTDVPGYTPIMLAVLLVGFIVTLGLGIVGSYVWRAYENTKQRPLTITQWVKEFPRSE